MITYREEPHFSFHPARIAIAVFHRLTTVF
jgi:hypothetical protein